MGSSIDDARMGAWRKGQEYAKWRWARGRTPTARELYDVRLPNSRGWRGLRELSGCILVPMRDDEDSLWALQTLSPAHPPSFNLHARIHGLSYHVGASIQGKVAITTTVWAAGMLSEEEGCPVRVAFTPDNLEHVARSLRARHPGARVVIWMPYQEEEPVARTAADAAGVDLAAVGDAGSIFSQGASA